MNKQFVDFRWGLPELDKEEESYVKVYDFMLEHYAEAGLSRDEFLLILHLAKYHFNTPKGKSRPSLESIAKYMGYAHINSVRRLVQSLERKGLLSIQHIDGKPSVYNVHGFAAKMRQLQHAKCSPTLEYTPTLACTPTPQCTPPLHWSVPEAE
jgi:hypothetical protein